jgi:hypothetical protein
MCVFKCTILITCWCVNKITPWSKCALSGSYLFITFLGFSSFVLPLSSLFSFYLLLQRREKRLLALSRLSVSPFIRMKQVCIYWENFRNIAYKEILLEYLRKNCLKSQKVTGDLHEDVRTFTIIFCWVLLGLRNTSC